MATYAANQGTIILPTVTTTTSGGVLPVPTVALDNTATIDPGVTITGDLGPGVVSITPEANVTNSGAIDGTGTVDAGLQATLNGIVTAAATVGVTLQVPTTPITASGVDLLTGGSVTNNAGGQITGAADGVFVGVDTGPTGVAQVTNSGTITGNAGAGVDLLLGGNVTNDAGTIKGATDGVIGALDTTVNNAAAITGTAGAGVDLLAGTGTVTNQAKGVIQGATQGVSNLGTGLIDNLGTIRATAGDGVQTLGALTNAAGANILGSANGVTATGVGAVDNAGTITGTAGAGVNLRVASPLTNDVGGAIQGGAEGVLNAGTGAIQNSGTITATAGDGVQTLGALTNNAGGTIAGTVDGVLGGAGRIANAGTITGGTSGVLDDVVGDVTNGGTIAATAANGTGVDLTAGGVVDNAGTITAGANGLAVDLGAGGSTLTMEDGSVLNGAAQAAGTGNTLNLNGVTKRVLADIGTTYKGFDATNLGNGANVEVTGDVSAPTAVTLGNGATLMLDGNTAAGTTVSLAGTDDTVDVNAPTFGGALTNFGTDDIADLQKLAPGSVVSLNAGLLTVTDGATGLLSTLATLLPTTGLGLTLDPNGTGVTVSAAGTQTTITIGTGAGGTNPGGGTAGGTNPGGGTAGGTNPGGGTAGGAGVAVGTDPTTGAPTITTTSPLGSTTTQVLPMGSTVAQGTGTTVGDAISISPNANFDGKGQFTITGHVAAGSGVNSVVLSAVVDGATDPTVLGTATVAADGSYSFADNVGAHLQGFITATETDDLGGTVSVQSPYSLQAGIKGNKGYVAEQDLFTADGSAFAARTSYKADGSRRVDISDSGQTFQSDAFDTFDNHGVPDSTFVFNQYHGLDTINLFRVDGADHDTISLPSADFQSMADVIANTKNVGGSAVITDTTTGDTIKLTGITKAELKNNPSDFTFHA